MHNIKIIDICGPICVDPEDGGNVCDAVAEQLYDGESVCLDFSGVQVLTGAFLNASVGCLHGRFEVSDLRERLSSVGLDDIDRQLMEIVRRGAEQFFRGGQMAEINEATRQPAMSC